MARWLQVSSAVCVSKERFTCSRTCLSQNLELNPDFLGILEDLFVGILFIIANTVPKVELKLEDQLGRNVYHTLCICGY